MAAWVYRNVRQLPVLACGGTLDAGVPLSLTMRNVLEQEGVPQQMIRAEQLSRSTHENAFYGARMLRQMGASRIILVSDARSMLRASLCFRKEGLQVIPVPCQFRRLQFPRDLLPSWRAIESNDATLHEVLGLAYYRLRGWI